ncbi:MAG: 50S ribosomal protein L11 methyltransferase [Gemmatimonadetes bacterium]|nr:50S ribosomal protein L11 methyltransferase [Gemmatimonadota bacterium]
MSRPSEFVPSDYDWMFADRVRTTAYLSAIASVVRPGDVVVEIGTGVGYFAVAAARAGARMVYAIESDPSIVLAEQLIRENGCGDRVRCVRGDANQIVLPERGTVLLSDVRGLLPLFGDAIPTLINVRERMLAPDARLIPRRDVVHAAPCTAPRKWAQDELALGLAPHGVSRQVLAARARSRLHGDRVDSAAICAAPAQVAILDYATITSPDVDATVSWAVDRAAPLEGIALWFDADLADSVGFSTSPSNQHRATRSNARSACVSWRAHM